MLEQIISKARQILAEAQANLSLEMAAAMERIFTDMENLAGDSRANFSRLNVTIGLRLPASMNDNELSC